MKTKLLLSLVLVLNYCLLLAQVPQGFNYQAIARDGSGNPITGASMQVKIGILSDTIANIMVWEELFNPVKTNAFGLFNIVVGTGVKQSGSAGTFSAIDWTKTPLFLRTSIYYPSAWKTMGTSKLQSVPYSMVAANLEGTVPLLSVKGNTTTMDSALFVVRNNTGQIVFAVYNEGVRIYVDDGVAGKGRKGGFAVGSFDKSKGQQDYFVVTGDSIRAYIDTGLVKTRKGGFAIGSFDKSKTGNEEYFRVTRDSTRVYIDDTETKRAKGGFAIGGFNTSKGSNPQYLRVTHDSTRIITADTIKGFGVSNLSYGNTLGYMRLTPSNYFIGHQAGKSITTGQYNSILGYKSGYSLNSGTSNSFIGYEAGYSNTSGSYNVFIGNLAGYQNNSSMNTFIGFIAGRNNLGYYNSFVGDSAGFSNTTGSNNTFLGGRSGFANTNGYYNTFIGSQAGYSNNSGLVNTFLGTFAGFKNTSGTSNTFSGAYAGYNNTTGCHNVIMGYMAGYLGDGGDNTLIGHTSGHAISSGYANTFVGQASGYNTTSGFYNIFIGQGAGFNNTSGYQNTVIGGFAFHNNMTGFSNIAIGLYAGENSNSCNNNIMLGNNSGYNSSNSNNLMIGGSAGYNNSGMNNLMLGTGAGSSNSGTYNVLIGDNAGYNNQANFNVFIGPQGPGAANTTGSDNIMIGNRVGITNTTGGGNVFIGGESGASNITGSNNVFLGHQAGYNETGSNKLYIDDSNTSSPLIWGDFGARLLNFNGNVGVGTTTPTAKLEVNMANPSAWSGNLNALRIYSPDNSFYMNIKTYVAAAGNVGYHFSPNGNNGLTITTPGFVGIGTITPGQKLDIIAGNGRVQTGYSWLTNSDVRYKRNISTLEGCLEKVMAMRGVSFDLRNDSLNTGTGKKNIGFIAQELENIVPEVVVTGSDGYKAVAYDKITAVLTEAIKEQQNQIASQQKEIDELKTLVNTLVANQNGQGNK